MVFRDDNCRRPLVKVHDDNFCLRRVEGADEKVYFVVCPRDDIHPLIAQLLHDGVDAFALLTDASASGINGRVFGSDGNFGAIAWVTHQRFDFHLALSDFGHMQFQQLAQQFFVRAGDEDNRFGRTRRLPQLVKVNPHLLALLQVLGRNLLPLG